ncbi:HlyD family secretion protein [Sandarakinorhabdus sp.]|uniref:HlyD family secretion protein n=1 Tax=Sandarakinorhabdus sp. TaxID=1916663 RepID=UPI00286DB7BF|nr:HlyD family secretion protein [Sandarakinorhabdus sp.]
MHARLEKSPATARVWRQRALMLSVPLLVAAVGVWMWLAARGTVSTDNAYVRQDKVAISSDVSSRIVDVLVTENQPVKMGQVLIRLADRPFQIALAQAQANLASARLQVRERKSGTGSSAAGIASARAALDFALVELARQQKLFSDGFATRARAQQAEFAVASARAELARATAVNAEAQAAAGEAVPVDTHPLVLAAMAARDKAAFDLSRTIIRTPTDGIATQTSKVLRGQVMLQGVSALSVMVAGSSYVEANFKETEIEDMRVGQRAKVTLDAYPSTPLTGRVASIGVGTGAEFSVLPAQNATGNWVKVVQRLPVRIVLDPQDKVPLIAGLSASVTVTTR